MQDSAWAYELSLYVHLNPVMRMAFGLGKYGKKGESQGMTVPDKETVTRRLSELRQFPWSSYRAYAGYVKVREIGDVAGAMDYTAVAMAIKRLEQKAASDVTLRRHMDQVAARNQR